MMSLPGLWVDRSHLASSVSRFVLSPRQSLATLTLHIRLSPSVSVTK